MHKKVNMENFMRESNKDLHYDELVKENILIAKTLSNLPEKQKEKVKNLLLKKQIIKQKNGFFAGIQIEIINKKINKIREDYNEKK